MPKLDSPDLCTTVAYSEVSVQQGTIKQSGQSQYFISTHLTFRSVYVVKVVLDAKVLEVILTLEQRGSGEASPFFLCAESAKKNHILVRQKEFSFARVCVILNKLLSRLTGLCAITGPDCLHWVDIAHPEKRVLAFCCSRSFG